MLDELLGISRSSQDAPQLLLATVGTVTSSGATLNINGAGATATRYKHVVTGQSLTAGDLVLVARISSSYVVIGKISN